MRTRFAPSPTGSLHVGGLRTALYAYLLAKQTGGKFILRIEDTDREREVPGSIDQIVASLHWAGLDPQEGVVLRDSVISQVGSKGPYMQSERLKVYHEHVDLLLKKGHAYHCFCSSQRLDEMRKAQQARGHAPMYDRHCLKLSEEEIDAKVASGEKHVIRMKIPHDRTLEFTDDVRGDVSFKGHTVDDQVLLKSDSFPTYHLAHVVDDHLMEIDIVIRAEEWLSSLPKHLLLWEYFEWPVPRYAHLPLLLNQDRSKLSKRQGDVSVSEYIRKGYLPEAMINFIAMLGWNPGTTQEFFTMPELIEQFSLERVQKAGAVFDLEKLDWLQGQWIRKLALKEFAERIKPIVAEQYPAAAKDPQFERKASLIHERITFFHETPGMLAPFYEEPTVSIELLANEKQKVTRDLLPKLLEVITATLEHAPHWTTDILLQAFKNATTEHGLKLGQLLWPLRAALTGREFSPGAVEVAEELGKEKTMERVKKAQELANGI